MQNAQQEFPPEEGVVDCAMTQPDADSGYGGSSNASLQTHDGHLDPEASSTASSSCSRPQPPSDTGTIQPVRIRPIPKLIDRETARRANDVIEQMSLLLREHMVKSKRYRYLSRPKRNPPSMSIRPIMLGTTEEDAKTCLVIFCADSHGAHDKIRDFLRRSFVKELYQPRDGTEPFFDVHIVGASPSTQAGVAVGIPINDRLVETSTCTLCGTSIYFVQEKSEQKQFATMGGILGLEFPDGTNDWYGLTAEHGAIDPSPDDSDTSMSDGGSDYDESSSRPTSVGDCPPTTLVQIDFDTGPCLDVPTRDDQAMHLEVDDLEPMMARVELSSLQNTQNGAFRDWALFPLPTKDLKPMPNMLQLQGQQPKALKIPATLTDMSESREVQIITGSSGLKRATLAPCLSRVLLRPGTAFVWAFTIELQTNSDIRLGDSGSWVVDPLTLEVYGHLVATDVLMGAYVIPLVDIIEDIRSRLSEVSVQFPSDSLLHPKDQVMESSLTRGSVVDWLEDAHHTTVSSAYDRNLYGSTSVVGASTIDGTEPPASVFSQPISTTTAGSSSVDPRGDVFKFRALEAIISRLGFKPASTTRLAPGVSRPALWMASSMRKMSRLYTYTTLPLHKILEVIYSENADCMPGLESANTKLTVLLDKHPRWIHPRNEDDMGTRLRELAKSAFRQKQKHHKSNPDIKGALARNVSGQEMIGVVSADQGSEPRQRSTALPPKSSLRAILSDYSSDYVNAVEMLMSRYSLAETLDAEAGVSTRDSWLHDASAPAVGCSQRVVPGDFLNLDELLVAHESCGQGLDRHEHRSCLCRVRDEVSTDDWVTASGPTPMATKILTSSTIAMRVSAFSLTDSFGNTTLHLLAARDSTKQRLMRATAVAPNAILMATNTANQTFLHVLGAFWFEDVTSKGALLPRLLDQLILRNFDICARDVYGRSFFHICQANVPDESAMEELLVAFGRGNFAYRDAFGVIPTGLHGYRIPLFEQKTEKSSRNPPSTSREQLLSWLRAAASNPSLEDSYNRNGLHLLADAVLSEDMDNSGASVEEDGRGKFSRSDRRPQTDSSFQMLSLRKDLMDDLLEAGVNPNHYNGDGNTALMAFAARLPEDDDYRLPCQIIDTLVKAGAGVNARNRLGETALHIAVRTGHKLVTRALVEAGANVYARDGEGRSVLDIADIKALHSKEVKDYAHAEAARAWLSGLQARAVQNPTVKQEWGM